MAETTSREQIDVWKKELAEAMDGQQWRLALKLCSWLRYALHQQEMSDPEVEEAHRLAKKAMARQTSREKAQKEREEGHRQLRPKIMSQIIHGDWSLALFWIEVLHQQGAPRRDVLDLLQEFKVRVRTLLSPEYRQTDPRTAALGRRYDKLVERVGGDPPTRGNKSPDKPND